jgi:hypothetical protein
MTQSFFTSLPVARGPGQVAASTMS